jgi:sigma-E factor negative regulatory protein RseC
MMIRQGFVSSTVGQRAVIQLTRHTACGDCGACQLGEENMQLQVEVINKIGAQNGDRVEIEMSDEKVLKAAFIVYIIPLIALFVGMGLVQLLFGQLQIVEGLSAIAGISLMVLSFLFIRRADKARKEGGKYEMEITQILEEDENTCSIRT